MEVLRTPDLQAKLNRLASQRRRASEALVVEALERLVSYDEWFIREGEKGLAVADRGELTDHEEIGKLLQRNQVCCAFVGPILLSTTSLRSAITSKNTVAQTLPVALR